MNKKGVTLLELVIVMVIIGIAAGFLVPNIGAWLANYRLRSVARDIVSTMRTAQMKAISTNLPYGIGFDANAYQLYRSSGGLTAEGAETNLPSGVQLTNNTFPINATLNKRFAQFNTDSTASGGGVTVLGTKGLRRITVTTITGRATITTP